VSRLLGLAIARRRVVVALFAAVASVAALGLPQLVSDNSPAVYAPSGTPEAERYERFVATFGADPVARLVVEGAALSTAAGSDELARLERRAAAVAGVRRSSSAADRAADDPLVSALGWRAPAGTPGAPAASVLLELEPLSPAESARLLEALDEVAASAGAGLTAIAIGSRSFEHALSGSAREIERRFFPLLVGFALVLLLVTFRDLGGIAVPLVFVAACEATTLGVMGWLGVRFHLVLAVLPPLLFAIAMASAVHLLIRCRALEAEGLDAAAATLATYRDKGRAVVWTSLSTAAGFGVLAASGVAPVRALGLWAAAGLGFQLLAAFTLLPALLAGTAGRRARLPERVLEARLESLGRRLATFAVARRRTLVGFSLLVAVVALAGLSRLGVESDVVGYFAPGHPMRVALERAEGFGFGLSTVELDLRAEEPPKLVSPPTLEQLAEAADELRALPGVLSVATVTDLLDSVGAESPWAVLSTAAELRAQALELLAAEPEGELALARFLAADRRAARVTLFVRTAGFEAIDRISIDAEEIVRRRLPQVDVAATGTLPLVLSFHRELPVTLGRSLALLVPVLAVGFLVLLRRPSDVLRALVPNLWPVLVLLGGMGWLGVRLDLATVMVASVVLGLAADDTIHALAHHRQEARAIGARAAVVGRIERTAPAFLLTGAILAAGFGVCALSSFAPIARFGALAAIGIVIAVATDLILLPALFAGSDANPASSFLRDRPILR
jgi:predicted RND superfamily exporter protein